MNRRALPFSTCALGLVALSACGANGEPMTVAADVLGEAPAEPTTSIGVAGSSTPPSSVVTGEGDTNGAVPSDDPNAPSLRVSNPNWPPITLAPGEPPVMPASVNVIGDSIALSAREIVTATLESLGVEVLAYDAVESRRMASGNAVLPSGISAINDVLAAGAYPEMWIIALGTNDVGAMSAPDEVRADIERVLGMVPPDAHLIWIDVWARPFDDAAVAFNALVRDVLTQRPYTFVVDWYAHAATDGLIIGDGVHLSDVGKVEYARLIGDALRQSFDRS